MLADVVRRKGTTAGSLDGGGWRELNALGVPWFDCLARILSKVEEIGVWPEGLLDAFFAMIPKADGDATPLGQRPFSVSGNGFLILCTVLVGGAVRWSSDVHLFVADVIKSFDPVDRAYWIGFSVVLGFRLGFGMRTSSTMLMCVCGSSWPLALVSRGLGMVGFLRGAP